MFRSYFAAWIPCSIGLAAFFAAGCGGSESVHNKLIILHTNDLHSYLMGHDPEADYTPLTINDDNTIGGFARLAGQIARERSAAGTTPVLLVDSGDFMMGSLFEVLALSRAAELVEMGQMGYDAIDLGNHEFDWTPRALAGIIAAARAGGFNAPLLASNMQFDPLDPGDDELQLLAYAGAIQRKTIKTLSNGVKVGIFGLLGKSAAQVTPQARPLTFADQATTAQAMVDELRDVDKVDLVICLSHSGTDERGKGEDEDLARTVGAGSRGGIDVIISGHTHVTLPSPVQVNNTLIVQTGAYGSNLGRLEIQVNGARNPQVSAGNYKLIPIDDSIQGDGVTQGRIDRYIDAIDALIAPYRYRAVISNTRFDLPGPVFSESGLGDLVADAYRAMVSAIEGPVDLAIEASGNIRSSILKGAAGNIWFADAFRVLPLGIGPDTRPGYPLVSFYVNGKELKAGMEISAAAQDVLQSNDYFLQLSQGAVMTYEAAGTPFNRVRSLRLPSGDVDLTDTSRCYKVVSTLYVGSLLGLVSQFTGGMLSVTPKLADCVTPIRDMTSRIVRLPPSAGSQELKAWLAFVQYASRGSVPDLYSASQGRIVRR